MGARRLLMLLVGALLRGSVALASADEARPLAPLLEGLGELRHPVSTRSEPAQGFFDQGLRLVYAFNHAEAIRSFKEAARLDPTLAMAHWGQALALGPNINDKMPPEREALAWTAIREARRLEKHASPRERAYIRALAVRYSNKKTRDRGALDQAYASAMKALHEGDPADADAATLYAESLMDLMPWDYWTRDGQPHLPYTPVVLSLLEGVLAQNPDHLGALHYFIHAVEASPDPARGLAAAGRLGSLAPTAGHLVHMPGHIYIRTGRYREAALANERAIAADDRYLSQCRAQGLYPLLYYPHNIHFLWAAATFEGRSTAAIEAARTMASKLTPQHACGSTGFQNWTMVPLYALVRFGRWDEILAAPKPSEKAWTTAIWHYARGLALSAQGRVDEAEVELHALGALQEGPDLEKEKLGFDIAATVLRIPANTLAAEIAQRRGRPEEGIRLLREAVAVQDALRYNEPPEWPQPVRHVLGAALLDAALPVEAETAYREDLAQNPENGWSLFGLLQSLRAQGRVAEAQTVELRFKKAWERADVVLTASRF